eukprot:6187111-Amphidinium_carterae.1
MQVVSLDPKSSAFCLLFSMQSSCVVKQGAPLGDNKALSASHIATGMQMGQLVAQQPARFTHTPSKARLARVCLPSAKRVI